jgi:hypothetical protein
VKDLDSAAVETRRYRVLNVRTSSLQKKLHDAGNDGYEYLGQTTMPNIFGGTDLVVVLERAE